MENKISDRSLIVPIIIGVFSVAGIALILLVLRISASRAAVQLTPTTTPLKFQFIATEPGVVTLAPTELSSPTEFVLGIEEPASATPELIVLATATFVSSKPTAATSNTFPSPSPTTTLQISGTIYDDDDFTLAYTGTWINQDGVEDVYKNTLHVSNAIGSAVQFNFTGQKIRIAYQAGPGLGTVAIILDGDDDNDFTLEQSADETSSAEWESPVLTLSSHTLTITHISGASINLDSISVIVISTPTPTLTPTP